MSDQTEDLYTGASVADLIAFDGLPPDTREMVERIVAYRLATAREQGYEAGLVAGLRARNSEKEMLK